METTAIYLYCEFHRVIIDMAGVRQHYIPQFLQQGFCIDNNISKGFTTKKTPRKKTKKQTYVFEKNKNPYKTSISNKGVERLFYGSKSDTLDSTITDAEREYSKLVNLLRSYQRSCLIDNNIQVAEFVVHILVRNKYLRSTMEESVQVVLNKIIDLFTTPEDLKIFLQTSSNFETRFDKEIKKQVEIVDELELLKNNPDFYELFIDKFASTLQPTMMQAFSNEKKKLSETAKNSHLKYLSQSISPPEKVKEIQELNWFVVVSQPHSYILGDVVLFYLTKEGICKPMFLPKTKFDNVVFPISDRHLLVGTLDTCHPLFQTDLINNASASLSRNYFISNQSTSKEKHYSNFLGSKKYMIPEYCSSECNSFIYDKFGK